MGRTPTYEGVLRALIEEFGEDLCEKYDGLIRNRLERSGLSPGVSEVHA